MPDRIFRASIRELQRLTSEVSAMPPIDATYCRHEILDEDLRRGGNPAQLGSIVRHRKIEDGALGLGFMVRWLS